MTVNRTDKEWRISLIWGNPGPPQPCLLTFIAWGKLRGEAMASRYFQDKRLNSGQPSLSCVHHSAAPEEPEGPCRTLTAYPSCHHHLTMQPLGKNTEDDTKLHKAIAWPDHMETWGIHCRNSETSSLHLQRVEGREGLGLQRSTTTVPDPKLTKDQEKPITHFCPKG